MIFPPVVYTLRQSKPHCVTNTLFIPIQISMGHSSFPRTEIQIEKIGKKLGHAYCQHHICQYSGNRYKNIVGSRKTCSYNRYVLIKGKINRGTYRNVSSEDVLITGMFL